MIKILSFKLYFFAAILFLTPLYSPLHAQDDDFALEAESWNEDALEDDIFLEESTVEETSVAADDVTSAPVESSGSPSSSQAAAKPEENLQQPASQPPATTAAPSVPSKPKKTIKPIAVPKPSYQTSSTVKRAGPPLMLIARPVYAPYSNELKTKYLSAVSEAYFHFKLGALPGIQVVPYEKIENNVQYFRDFSRRISRKSYLETAKKMGATYLLYSEYEPQDKSVKFAVELYSIADNKKVVSRISDMELSELEDGLYDYTVEVGGAIIGTIPQGVQEFLSVPVLGNNLRKIESFGNTIVSTGEFSQKKAEKNASDFKKLSKDRELHLAKYFGALILARAKLYKEAITLQEELKSSFGTNYPALSLQLARFHRMANEYNEALRETENAAREPSLTLPAHIEKARIYEAQGNLNQAKQEYESVLAEGGQDGEIYFELALVSIGLNNLSQAQQYLEKAASSGRSLDKDDYFNLGLRYEALGTANEQAIQAYRNCLGLQQDNEEAWERLAKIYTASGRESDAAECYVNLFQINNAAYKDQLVKAGILFESSGYLENAKDAYSLFLARRFNNTEVNVRLAKLEMQGGDCKRAIELVDGMDTTGTFGPDVGLINTQCGKQERRVVIPTDPDRKNWRGPFFWRVSSGVLTATGLALSYFYDSKVKEQLPDYHSAQTATQVELERSKLQSLETKRNLCYIGTGIGLTSLAFSITLPIVFSSNN